MSDRDDVLSLPAGRELDVKVAEALGLPGIVKEWAVRDSETGGWDVADNCDGSGESVPPTFFYRRHPVFERLREGAFVAREIVPFYSTSGDEAVALAQRFHLTVLCHENGRVEAWQDLGDTVKADSIPHAVARWVARYVKNGEVSDE